MIAFRLTHDPAGVCRVNSAQFCRLAMSHPAWVSRVSSLLAARLGGAL